MYISVFGKAELNNFEVYPTCSKCDDGVLIMIGDGPSFFSICTNHACKNGINGTIKGNREIDDKYDNISSEKMIKTIVKSIGKNKAKKTIEEVEEKILKSNIIKKIDETKPNSRRREKVVEEFLNNYRR